MSTETDFLHTSTVQRLAPFFKLIIKERLPELGK